MNFDRIEKLELSRKILTLANQFKFLLEISPDVNFVIIFKIIANSLKNMKKVSNFTEFLQKRKLKNMKIFNQQSLQQ